MQASDVLISAQVEVPTLWVPEGQHLSIAGTNPFHLFDSSYTIGRTFGSQANRESALTIATISRYQLHRVLRLPAGTSFVTPLPEISLSDNTLIGNKDPLRADRKATIDGNTLVEDFSFAIPTGDVSLEKTADFLKVGRKIDDAFRAVVRLSRTGKKK
jgi:hypothetical protein